MSKLNTDLIQVPKWIIDSARRSPGEIKFFDAFEVIRRDYKTAWEAYEYMEREYSKYFGETRYKNYETFWKRWRQLQNKKTSEQ